MLTNIKKYNFKTGLSQEFEIVDIAKLYNEFKETLITTHRADFYHIIWFQKGGFIHLVDFNPIKIEANTFLFINKDTVQRFDNKKKLVGKAILFTDTFFCKSEDDTKFLRNSILFNNLFSVSYIQVQNQLKVFSDLLRLMTVELENRKDDSQSFVLQNLLHNFLLLSEREKCKQNFIEFKNNADFEYVMLFKDLLETGYKNQKQVNYYAKEIIITEKRLNQATTKILGKTPKEIIDDRILLEAKRIIAHTTESIKEISHDLGFEEPTNFIKYFKKHVQLTPTEFREKINLA